ncbi:exo-alpha-sialidase [Candidatus Poribacteria bacterium]|nr:exo-alpha-sialidase [Candidatus Poribacteria bacterium]
MFVTLSLLTIIAGIQNNAEIVEVEKIWDKGTHNAFTDLVYHKGKWFCVFREGQGHVSPDGALRVITSEDGDKWKSAALITSENSDLRDAKISVAPDDRLVLAGAGALHQPAEHRHQSMIWYSENGTDWGDPIEIGDPDFWIWRITWHKDKAYGIGYGTGGKRLIRLYKSDDGINFDTHVENLFDEGYPNETSMIFLEDDTCLCLLRRDGDPSSGLLGESKPPYTQWSWKDLGVKIGGPHMIQIPDGRFVAAVRLYDEKVRTSLMWVDPEKGELTEFLTLPSGGDTSYPGLVWHDDMLWVSYYSSHEGKTSIYLAKVKIK